jgi:error-prone DNA polymerase
MSDRYTELHAKSAFSFLRGASNPEDVVAAGARHELPAVAFTERNGLYSSVRAHLAAREQGLRAIVGAEVTLEDGSALPLLVETQAGYRNLCRLLTLMKRREGASRDPIHATWEELAAHADGLHALTGDEEGPLRAAWRRGDNTGAAQALRRLAELFPGRLHVELQRHRVRGEDIEERFLVDLARAQGLPLLATNGVLYAERGQRRVADAFTCLRHRRTVDTAGRLLEVNEERAVKSGAMMAALFRDLPEAIRNTAALAERLAFGLGDLGYRFPDFPVPAGESMDSWLRKITYFGAAQRYGHTTGTVRAQLDKELGIIGRLGFAGYFLVVWDICNFCREQGILAQGRGSAANSAVCYALGITAVDPIGQKLLFERFLSEGRTGWPDIDIDLPSRDRRERVIQEVFRRYPGRSAMTANVICYRGRNTMREMGKVLGFPDDVLDRYTSLYAGGDYPHTLAFRSQLRLAGIGDTHPRVGILAELVKRTLGLPRHLGQHSGGIVLCAGRLDDVVPMQDAAMPGRHVIEWDKTDCEDMGIVKVDLLGLGMMAAVEETLHLCEERGTPVDLARIPKDDPATYDLLCRADTVGVFQVESRAQMASLPRFRPRCFYDLAMQVAIIRPGPIQGEAVHPLIDRRAGRQPVTYWDPRLEPILGRTYGVVLFQEQLLRIAMDLARFTPAEADELRRSIDFKRNQERMRKMQSRLRDALAANDTAAEASDKILHALSSFALYSFPESHALSFALIAFTAAWLKVHRPAEFYVGLLNAQPMGFYAPATLVQDARRHGITVRPPCVAHSGAGATVEAADCIRVGLSSVRGLGSAAIDSILAARAARPFDSVADCNRRTKLSARECHTLSSSGALNVLAGSRRQALWASARAALECDLFAGTSGDDASGALLTPMTLIERIRADFETVGLTAGEHPMRHLRSRFPDLWRADELALAGNGTRVRVGGSVICRQRPGTAKGVVFVSLEDETGIANAILYADVFEANRLTVTQHPALVLEGPVQHHDGVIHVKADRITPLLAPELPAQASHDFH